MRNQRPQVVVIGGGYAGVMAANRVQGSGRADVTLVNPRTQFVERIRLHQLAVGNDDAVEEFADVLNPGVRLVVDSASRLERETREVVLRSGATLGYDYLVYAVGSTGAVPAAVPGAPEHAFPLSELEQAERLRRRLLDVSAEQPVVVVGGGLTGIEAASELAEAGRRVTLVSSVIAPSLSGPGKRSVAKRLRKLGVTLVEGDVASVRLVGTDFVELASGRRLPSAVTVWTAGFGVPGLAVDSGLTTDPLGRLVTEETLVSVDDPRIVATGDAAAPSGSPFRMSCQASLPLGAQAGDAVVALIAGAAPVEATVPMAGQCISLGRGAGTIQAQRKDDTPLDLYLGGRVGALVKERVCRRTLTWMRDESERPGSYRTRKGTGRTPAGAAGEPAAEAR